MVKTTTKLSLQSMETKTVTGFVRKSADIESAITEPIEQGNLTKVTVCPRVVTLNNPGKTSRVPVKIFNMSAKVVTIPPRANICELHEVKVLRSPEVVPKTKSTSETTLVNQ